MKGALRKILAVGMAAAMTFSMAPLTSWADEDTDYFEVVEPVVFVEDAMGLEETPADEIPARNVIEINGTGYTSLTAAIADSTDQSVLKLVEDIDLVNPVEIQWNWNGKLTIDLNGHTIHMYDVTEETAQDHSGAQTTEDGGMIVADNGTLCLMDSSETQEGKIISTNKKYPAIVMVQDETIGNHLIITGGTYLASQEQYILGFRDVYGNPVSADAVPPSQGEEKDQEQLLTVSISGGIFNDQQPAQYLAPGYKQELNTEGNWELVEETSYIISFDPQTEDIYPPESETVPEGGYATEPWIAERDGFTFDGWYAEGAENRFDFDYTPIYSDMTLYAHWSADPALYTVSFDVQTDEVYAPESETVEEGGYAQEPWIADRDGYILDGWYVEGTEETFDFDNTPVYSNLLLMADWETENWTVRFSSDLGEPLPDDQVIENGRTASRPEPEPFADGYSLDGWYAEGAEESFDFENTAIYQDITLYAHWTEIPKEIYAVTFYNRGIGITPDVQSVVEGDYANRPEDPSEAGYIFRGWYTDEENTEEYLFDTPVTSNIDLYAKWELVEYTVTWLNWDDSELASETYSYNSMPVYPFDAPVRTEDEEYTYSFTGWDPEPAVVTGDAAYTAVYEATQKETDPVTYMITWQDWDGTLILTTEVNEGEDPQYEGDTPARAEDDIYTYTFIGWTPDVTPATGDVVYTATYAAEEKPTEAPTTEPEPAQYTITWQDWNGMVLGSASVAEGITPQYEGDTPTRAEDDTYTYAFIGWTPDVSPAAGDVVYTATYAAEEKPTEAPTTETPTTEPEPTTTEAPTTEPEPTTTEAPTTEPEPAQYTITWQDWNGTVLGSASVAEGITPQYEGDTPTRAEDDTYTYAFIGWTPDVSPAADDVVYTATYAAEEKPTEAPTTETPTTEPEPTTTEVPTTLATYTVTFYTSHGDTPQTQSVEQGKAVTRPADPTASGYIFGGWYTDEACTQQYNFAAPVEAYLILYAKWTEEPTTLEKYSVTFYSSYGETPAGQLVESGQRVEKPADPTASGYIFGGWFTDLELTNAYDFNAPVSSNMTLFAKWTEEETTVVYFQVSYYSERGTIPGVETVESGMIATKPADPVADGYVFAGWYREKELNNLYDFNTPVTANITLYAKWVELPSQNYIVSFDANGHGNTPNPQTVQSGTAVSKPSDPTATGYIFEGWYTDPNGAQAYDFKAAVNANMTLYARWAANRYTVKFDANGGVGTMPSQSYVYDTKAILPANAFTRTGYNFVGWNTKADGSGQVIANSGEILNLTADSGATVNLYAQWKNIYNVIEGVDAKIQKGGTSGITFRVDGDYSKFTGIRIDNNNVSTSQYTSWAGSTYVQLKADYVNQMPTGTHTIQFQFTDGSCQTTFETLSQTPRTGDTNNTLIWIIIAIAALIIIAVIILIILGRRRRDNRYDDEYDEYDEYDEEEFDDDYEDDRYDNRRNHR